MTDTNQKLREALRYYGKHTQNCATRNYRFGGLKCDCGLDAALSLPTQAEPVEGGEVPCFPINGKVWFRESTNEWVLELSGVINDTNFTVRHTCPPDTKPEDVVDLPNLYPPASQEQVEDCKGWYCAHCQRGVDGSEVTYPEQTQQSQASESRCCLSCLTPRRCNEYMEGGWTCPDVLNDQEQQPAAQEAGLTDEERADMACAVAAICTGTSSRTVAATAIEWTERALRAKGSHEA